MRSFRKYPSSYVKATKADTLDKYVGKDIWLKVKISEKAYFRRGYKNDQYWIRILDKDGNSYIVNKVSSYKEYKGNETQKNASLSKTYTVDKNSITIFDPVRTATTDEIFGDVHACSKVTAASREPRYVALFNEEIIDYYDDLDTAIADVKAIIDNYIAEGKADWVDFGNCWVETNDNYEEVEYIADGDDDYAEYYE